MKKILLSITFVVISFTNIFSQHDSISYTAGYAKDVFYSMENGVVKSEIRTNYDIAFSTNKMSSSLLINDGSGVTLFTYPNGDTSAWNTIDTAGINGWPAMRNSEESWEEGAFGAHALGHPDYGWGIYNMVTHNLTGDSLFVIKTRTGSYKKLWIIGKESMAGIYHFRFASLDGSNDTTVELNATPYAAKNFIYYDLNNKLVVDREPDSDSWDIMFTKYMGLQPVGGYYAVTGVLSNAGVEIAKLNSVDTTTVNWPNSVYSDGRSVIGWDWKTFSMSTMSYQVSDSLVHFIKNNQGAIYKLIFTGFAGTATGNVYFNTQLLSSIGIETPVMMNEIGIYPNPTSDFINITNPLNQKIELTIFDLSGKLILSETTQSSNHQLSVDQIKAGLYLLTIQSGTESKTLKFIIE